MYIIFQTETKSTETSNSKNNDETDDENKQKNNMTNVELNQTVIENLPKENKDLVHRLDKLIANKSSEELYFLPKRKSSRQLNLKCSYLRLSSDYEPLNPLNSQPEPEFDKTLNEIKKTRQELIDEYKTMMQSQRANVSQSPIHFRNEPISFGKNVKFLRTNTISNLKRPRFEDTLHILMRNKTFFRGNKN